MGLSLVIAGIITYITIPVFALLVVASIVIFIWLCFLGAKLLIKLANIIYKQLTKSNVKVLEEQINQQHQRLGDNYLHLNDYSMGLWDAYEEVLNMIKKIEGIKHV